MSIKKSPKCFKCSKLKSVFIKKTGKKASCSEYVKIPDKIYFKGGKCNKFINFSFKKKEKDAKPIISDDIQYQNRESEDIIMENEMKILFCNVAWMKYYNGITDNDKPVHGGKYIDEKGRGAEVSNFQDYNGKCYGYVSAPGKMRLEEHFEEAGKHSSYVKDVLVVWVATKDNNDSAIVGWYKNAVVYRTVQDQKSFTNKGVNPLVQISYNIKADAKNCYLLPERQRTFAIPRAAKAGKGKGMGKSNIWYAESIFAQINIIPQVINYINSYKGKYVNTVYTNKIINAVVNKGNKKSLEDCNKFYDKGKQELKRFKYLSALKYFNTAKSIKETANTIFYVAHCLSYINQFDKAIELFEKVIRLEGNKADTVEELIICYDLKGNYEKTLKYCKRLLNILNDSKKNIKVNIHYLQVMFKIYVFLDKVSNARKTINTIATYTGKETEKHIKQMKNVLKERFESKFA